MRNNYLQQCDYGSRFRILKGGKIALVVSAFIASITLLQAAPTGGVVTSGTASIAQSGSVTNITQTTQKAAINWQNFSIGASETVNFNQPNVSAITLNRVVGNEKSIIDGALNANGQVFILNSNGLLFSKNASINTAGLVATTMNLSDADFMNGNYAFKGDSSASIINQGTINISDKGYAALFGKEVINEGVIRATLGKVHVIGASEVTLNLNGNSLVNLTVDKGVLDALVENKGAIYADGGEVYLTTNAVNELLRGVVNNTGIVEANTLDDIAGKVILFAHGGEAQVGGSIKAEGGFVETSGKEFTIKEGATMKAKEWLIDPVNITIDSTLAGTIGTALGTGDVTITTDGTCTGVTCSGTGSDGDITVNSAISWASNNDLTLSAYRNIIINKNITATGAGGKVSLYYGQGALTANNTSSYSFGLTNTLNATTGNNFTGQINLQAGQNFSTKIGSDGTVVDYTVITALGTQTSSNDGTLQGMKGALAGKFVLGANIDASDTNSINNGWTVGGAGFTPIGYVDEGSYPFTGSFNGLGHTIANLTINSVYNYSGLFGLTNGATISNVGLTNANIVGTYYVGTLVGSSGSSTITDSYATGSVTGVESVGGLVGNSYNTDIINSYSTGDIVGEKLVGGLIGAFVGDNRKYLIKNSYATGSITAKSSTDTSVPTASIGGLVGYAGGAAITDSYYAPTTGKEITIGTNVDSQSFRIGGLVGEIGNNVLIENSYSLGNINIIGNAQTFADSYLSGIGGLVGVFTSEGGKIVNSYATGDITIGGPNAQNIGGLVGRATATEDLAASIENSYATGGITTTFVNIDGDGVTSSNVGGLVGYLGDYVALSSSHYAPTTGKSITLGNTATDTGHTISNSSSESVGGLVGLMEDHSTVSNSYSLGNINISGNASNVGGLIGYVDVIDTSFGISNSYASGNINIRYAKSEVTGIGGLVGYSRRASIQNSFATGSILAALSNYDIYDEYASYYISHIGGFVGNLYNSNIVTNVYATGSITANMYAENNSILMEKIGGLIGYNYKSSVSNAYATGLVAVTLSHHADYATYVTFNASTIGGLVGSLGSTTPVVVENSFYQQTPTSTSVNASAALLDTPNAIGTKKTAAGLKAKTTFATWSIRDDGTDNDAVWRIYEGNTMPLLASFMTPVTKYGTSGYSEITPSFWHASNVVDATKVLGTSPDFYSNQMYYDLSFDALVVVTPPTQDLTPIITQIVNNTAIQPPVMPSFAPPTPPAPPSQQFSFGGQQVQLASTPSGDTPTQLIGMQEARQMMQSGGTGDIRIPLGQNSLVQLVNGGVSLPIGLEQEFFMAQR